MRIGIYIICSILLVAIFVMIVIRQNYKNAPDYNYITAKIDIRNGNEKIVNIGLLEKSSLDKKINEVAQKYGFKNIYVAPEMTKDMRKGIENYNSVIETYLKIRNGDNWRPKYESEIDSLYNATSPQANSAN